ncbi:MAG: hypothetical protein H6Q89_2534 [Myxococcaceae bacterium]|nr:hypothetical protein [Myxococcaceae bacterium]
MSTFASSIRSHLPFPLDPADIDAALAELGVQSQLERDALPTAERAALVDRFVRNLRHLPSSDQLSVERALLEGLGCQPRGTWNSHLDGAVALIELRGHMKHTLAVLGLDWASLSRLQSLVGGLARWLQHAGGATLDIHSSTERVEFVIATRDAALTPELITASPMVQMLRPHVAEVTVRQNSQQIEILFRVARTQ